MATEKCIQQTKVKPSNAWKVWDNKRGSRIEGINAKKRERKALRSKYTRREWLKMKFSNRNQKAV